MLRQPNTSVESQEVHFNKAITSQEVPIKLKHVRALVICTHLDGSSRVFWSIASRAQLRQNSIIGWKFFNVVYKVLRDGHKRVLSEAELFMPQLKSLFDYWSLLSGPYGRLIVPYARMVLTKVRFHAKYVQFPGSLEVSDSQLDRIGDNDANKFFELAVDLLDYLDEIISVQTIVYGRVEAAGLSSMTRAGQCMLAPLLPCIQESLQLYNHTVKILFKLHSSLPPDLLSGHRQRFGQIFDHLKAFYVKSSSLQYFKELIKIPLLPQNAPNFFRACQQSDRVAAAVLLCDLEDDTDADRSLNSVNKQQQQQEEERLREQQQRQQQQQQEEEEQQRLREQQRRQQNELERQRQQQQQLQEQLSDTRFELGRARNELSSCREEVNSYRRQLEAAQELNDNISCRLEQSSASEKALKTAATAVDAKFDKLKSVYQQLREEHIQLIRDRSAADVERQKLARKLSEQNNTNWQEQEQQLQSELDSCRSRLLTAEAEVAVSQSQADAALVERDSLLEQMQQNSADADTRYSLAQKQQQLTQQRARDDVISAITDLFTWCRRELDNPAFSVVTCPPDYLHSLCSVLLHHKPDSGVLNGPSISSQPSTPPPPSTPTSDADILVSPSGGGDAGAAGLDSAGFSARGTLVLAHQLTMCVLFGQAMAHTCPDLALSEEIGGVCRTLADSCLQWTSTAAAAVLPLTGDTVSLSSSCTDQPWRDHVHQLQELAARVTASLQGECSSEQLAALLKQEMAAMDAAINAAAQRMQEIISAANSARESGQQPHVPDQILTTCTSLMECVRQLVLRARHLQSEIVANQRATSASSAASHSSPGLLKSDEEFYVRNHRWTEGLITAAKAVAVGANTLIGAADTLMAGRGKFEELIVATHEIAASTAQLVIASKVKADRESTNLAQLTVASRQVSEATGSLVATVKSHIEQVEQSNEVDLGTLSLHQTRRRQMDCQVRVLELQCELERERNRLASLRRLEYQLTEADQS